MGLVPPRLIKPFSSEFNQLGYNEQLDIINNHDEPVVSPLTGEPLDPSWIKWDKELLKAHASLFKPSLDHKIEHVQLSIGLWILNNKGQVFKGALKALFFSTLLGILLIVFGLDYWSMLAVSNLALWTIWILSCWESANKWLTNHVLDFMGHLLSKFQPDPKLAQDRQGGHLYQPELNPPQSVSGIIPYGQAKGDIPQAEYEGMIVPYPQE